MAEPLDDVVARTAAEVLGLDRAEVHPGSDIVDDLGGTSLELLEIVTRLETELDVAIPDEAIASMTTVQAVVDGLRAQLAA